MTIATATPQRPVSIASATGPSAVSRTTAHPSATVARRPGESAAELRGRVLRAAERLNLLLAAGGHVATRWALRLERQGIVSVMPLPRSAFKEGARAFSRRLPDRALALVDVAVISARLGANGATAVA